MTSSAPITLLDLLDLQPAGDDRFVAPPHERLDKHLFGGHIAAEALRAATLTASPDRLVHSFHAYYVRRGDVTKPVLFDVHRVRDGASYSTRQVSCTQDGLEIMTLLASFAEDSPGGAWQSAVAPTIHDPGTGAGMGRFAALGNASVFDIDLPPGATDRGKAHPLWIRSRHDLGSDESILRCALASMSDLSVAWTAHGNAGARSELNAATICHSVWFQHTPPADQWMLMECDSSAHTGERGLANGAFYERSGRLLATFAQEAMMRPMRA
ncbi:MAG: acyl-CoA thioesterase [Acidimicrobiia bacterium]